MRDVHSVPLSVRLTTSTPSGLVGTGVRRQRHACEEARDARRRACGRARSQREHPGRRLLRCSSYRGRSSTIHKNRSPRRSSSTPITLGNCSGVSSAVAIHNSVANASSWLERSATRASPVIASPRSSCPRARSQKTPPGYAAPNRNAYSSARSDLPIPPIPVTFTAGSPPCTPVISPTSPAHSTLWTAQTSRTRPTNRAAPTGRRPHHRGRTSTPNMASTPSRLAACAATAAATSACPTTSPIRRSSEQRVT